MKKFLSLLSTLTIFSIQFSSLAYSSDFPVYNNDIYDVKIYTDAKNGDMYT